ncbi:MAG: hypothetical protein JWR26_889 [Pedosphaera sp.]|nr:hypothetical protein [Pedosphaera sp.]
MNMKRQIQLFLAVAGSLALVLTPLKGWSATSDTVISTNAQTPVHQQTSSPVAPPPPVAAAIPPEQTAENLRHLTAPVREVVTMATSGVADDVVKAYVDSSASTFNLTPQSIIRLKDLGVPGPVIAAMLKHDKVLRDNANMPPAPEMSQPIPGINEPPPENIQNAQPSDSGYSDQQIPPDYYDQLASYGNWNYAPDYGWGWQPDSSFWPNYASWGYPWGWLNSGWGFWPGFGWSWSPRFHDRDRFGNRFDGRFANRFGDRFNNRLFNGRDNFALNQGKFNNFNFKTHGDFQSFARRNLFTGNSAIRNAGFGFPVNNRFGFNGFNNGFNFRGGQNRFAFNQPLGSHFRSQPLGSHFGTFGHPGNQGFSFGGGFGGGHGGGAPAFGGMGGMRGGGGGGMRGGGGGGGGHGGGGGGGGGHR